MLFGKERKDTSNEILEIHSPDCRDVCGWRICSIWELHQPGHHWRWALEVGLMEGNAMYSEPVMKKLNEILDKYGINPSDRESLVDDLYEVVEEAHYDGYCEGSDNL